jgi:hypothetical protein
VAALLPVEAGREEALLAALRGLPRGADSPFGRIESTHFARLVLAPALPDRHDSPLADVPACLFLAAEFDIPRAAWLEAMCTLMPAEADAVLGHCRGYPGTGVPPRLADWVLEHRVAAGFSLHGNPDATAGEVVQALGLRERLIAFAVETRALDAREFGRRWEAEDWDGAT